MFIIHMITYIIYTDDTLPKSIGDENYTTIINPLHYHKYNVYNECKNQKLYLLYPENL